MGTLLLGSFEGLQGGQALRTHRAGSFAKGTAARREDPALIENLVYQLIKICQDVNKWFGCRKLQRKKFSVRLPVGLEFLTHLDCAR